MCPKVKYILRLKREWILVIRMSSERKSIPQSENYKLNKLVSKSLKSSHWNGKTGPSVELRKRRRKQRGMVIVRSHTVLAI